MLPKMSTDPASPAGPRRLALVVAAHSAALGTPPGVDPAAFSAACLADSYEVLADLRAVTSGLVGRPSDVAELLWPGAVQLPPTGRLSDVVDQVRDRFDEVVFVPGDVPDLPGLVVAKVFKALQRADVCLCAERGSGGGLSALGVRVPWPSWVPVDLDLAVDPAETLTALAPRRGASARGPDWHRLRTPAAIDRLDPGLEGWEMTRSLLAGRVLGSR
jgi:hypothetical protein